MKSFHYDVLLDREDICNLSKEREVIEQAVGKKGKLVVYGPRNFGKTSLIKSVILPDFITRNEKNFVFFADLMEVKSQDSIDQRISKGFEIAFSQSFPAKHFVEGVRRFLGSFRPQVSLDPNTGAPSLSITPHPQDKKVSCEEILKTVINIARERDTIIVLDEFQDIALVSEAEALFRRVFQEIKEIPVIVMGSKRHILADILARPNAPLSMFGEDVEFKPISYDEYHEYIMERFRPEGLNMTLDDSKYLQDAVLRIPEAINIVCAGIIDEYENANITSVEIDRAIHNVVERRQSRYEGYLSNFSENEESVIVAIAKEGAVKHPNSREFLKTVRPTSRMVGIIVKQLLDKSVVDKNADGYYISDPLFSFYLRNYR